jgi:hypothetical protein
VIFQFSKFSPKLSTYRWDTLYIMTSKNISLLLSATIFSNGDAEIQKIHR